MSRYWDCDNDREHQREAERDFDRLGRPDREMESEARWNRYGCSAAYMDRYRELESRAEERRDQEERDQREADRCQREARDGYIYDDDGYPEPFDGRPFRDDPFDDIEALPELVDDIASLTSEARDNRLEEDS